MMFFLILRLGIYLMCEVKVIVVSCARFFIHVDYGLFIEVPVVLLSTSKRNNVFDMYMNAVVFPLVIACGIRRSNLASCLC